LKRLAIATLTMAAILFAEEGRGSTPKVARTLVRVTAGEQEPSLEKQAFAAKLDGNPARVLRVLGPEDDLVLLLVLDLSGDQSLVDAAREALVGQMQAMRKNHWVGLMRAQDRFETILDPTADREKLSAAVKEYAAVGKAGLLNTVEVAAALGHRLLQKSGVRVAVMYVTDSNIANYREDYTNPVINSSDSRDLSRKFPDELVKEKIQKISNQLAKFETPVYIVQLSFFGDAINQAYQRGLLQLAEESGGAGVFCRSQGDIAPAIEQVVSAASRHWSVAVELKNPKQRSVSVDLRNGEREVPSRARFALGK
jgi:hypothetical protein